MHCQHEKQTDKRKANQVFGGGVGNTASTLFKEFEHTIELRLGR
jgi:hypothetical protein